MFLWLKPPLTEQDQDAFFAARPIVMYSLPWDTPGDRAVFLFQNKVLPDRSGFQNKHLVLHRGLKDSLGRRLDRQGFACQTEVFFHGRRG